MGHVTLQINGRLQPLDRGEFYEDPLDEALEQVGCGFTDGGGTLMEKGGEISFCDVEISLNDDKKETLDRLLEIIDDLGLPKGSLLRGEGFELPVGRLEGLALYVNGTELAEEVYAQCDINYVIEKINELLAESGHMYSHWAGPQDTALYFYGPSFAEMEEKMRGFVSEYPLCQKCRIEKIA